MKYHIIVSLLFGLFSPSFGHIVLTFPPARKYALDFLDNTRTPSPCGGMLKAAGAETRFTQGQTVNVTWHIAYPHRGGYAINLLNADGTFLRRLLPSTSGYKNANDATVLHDVITIPADVTCTDCTLQIVRQALEWGPSYRFRSCSDVIIDSNPVPVTCSGHGTYQNGQCVCLKPFVGPLCQYEDECWVDSDCGAHGRCVDTGATYYPKQQCYCEAPWFGPDCSMSFTGNLDFTFGGYQKTTLSSGKYELYHRVLQDELEIVMKVKSTSWVALGWRHPGVTTSCKTFPVKSNTIDILNLDTDSKAEPGWHSNGGTSEPKAEPEGTAEPKAEPEGTSEPKTEPEGTAEPKTEPEGTAEPKTEPEGISEPQPEPEGTSEPQSKPEGGPTPGSATHPKFNGHPMDCTDIVIGSARGNLSRVRDYFTRDRSTPREDKFYAGSFSLTAAMGMEKLGYTYIMFRRKLIATEPQDYTFVDAPMSVIWAHGQESGNYIHRPPSGVDVPSSNPQYYHDDELKYHGYSPNRGTAELNFFKINKPVCSTSLGSCVSQANCDFHLTWSYDPNKRIIRFTMKASIDPNQWMAIGFSKDKSMANTDIILGYVENGQVSLTDRYAATTSEPAKDAQYDLTSVFGHMANGITTLSFTRPLDTGDKDDFAFSVTECPYIFYGRGTRNGNIIGYHYGTTPLVSDQPVCLLACDNSVTSNDVTMTASFRILSVVFRDALLDSTSPDFVQLAGDIGLHLTDMLVPVVRSVTVAGFRKGSVIVDITAKLEASTSATSQFTSALTHIVTSRWLEDFELDPDYIMFSSDKTAPSGTFTCKNKKSCNSSQTLVLNYFVYVFVVIIYMCFL